jgi:hypothetical protein
MASAIIRYNMQLLLLGLLVTSASWVVAWSDVPTVSEYSFLPLWLGYILTVNGLSELLTKDSLIRKMGIAFMLLFAASIPFWWFFEFINSIVQNWDYKLPHPISDCEFSIRASVNFSTVVPAVLSTTFLFYRFLKGYGFSLQWTLFRIRRRWLFLSILIGVVSLCLLAFIPRIAFPLVWIAPLLLLEPFLYAFKYPSLLHKVEKGEWLLVASIMMATLFTGFWWELWNVYSSPKWIYTIPYLGFWKVFEMPFLGYFGYPFFGLIIYSYTMFVFSGLSGKDSADDLICSHPLEKGKTNCLTAVPSP